MIILVMKEYKGTKEIIKIFNVKNEEELPQI